MHAKTLGAIAICLGGCTSAEPARTERALAFQPLTPPPPVVVEPRPVAPMPEIVAPTGPDPIAIALAPDDPAAVTIVARTPVSNDLVVLYALDVMSLRRPEDDDACAALELRGKAIDEYEELECVHHEPAHAWELARVHLGVDAVKVRARTRVWGADVGALPGPDNPPKLKVYDIDRDRRSEITVVFAVSRFDEQSQTERNDGEIGAIFDATDLHLQLAVTRRFATQSSDIFQTENAAETVWVAKDLDGDGHPDLTLTGKTMTKDNNACDVDCEGIDEEAALRPQRARAQQVCPYEVAGDRWVCPHPQLGRELLEGNDGVHAIAPDEQAG